MGNNHLARSEPYKRRKSRASLTLTIAPPNVLVAVAYPVVLLSAAADKRMMVGGGGLGLQCNPTAYQLKARIMSACAGQAATCKHDGHHSEQAAVPSERDMALLDLTVYHA
jgi:hypothetical protein